MQTYSNIYNFQSFLHTATKQLMEIALQKKV